MKTPQDLDKIYNKLPKEKTELSKVELAIADDVKKLASQSKAELNELRTFEKRGLAFQKNLTKLFQEGEKLEKVMIKAANNSDKTVDRVIKVMDKADDAAKALGVSPNAIEGYSELLKTSNILEGTAQDIVSLAKKMFA